MLGVAVVFYFALLIPVLYSQSRAAKFCPWVPTRKKDLPRILKFAALKKGETFIDLGCGDGRVVRYLGRHSDANCCGIELSLLHFFYAKVAGLFGSRKASVRYGDLLKMDLSRADVLFIYGYPTTLQTQLKPKLERELKAGARVISYEFPVFGWKIAAADKGDSKAETPLFAYSLDRERRPEL